MGRTQFRSDQRAAGESQNYLWSTDTTATNPGAGYIKVDNSNLALLTNVYVNEKDNDGNILSKTWKTECIKIFDPVNPANWAIINIYPATLSTIGITNPWDSIGAQLVSLGGSFTNNLPVRVISLGGPLKSNDVIATQTNDDAPAGSIGEFVSSSIVSGSAVSLVTATAKTMTSISLTGGDWDIQGVIAFLTAATTTITSAIVGISTVNNGQAGYETGQSAGMAWASFAPGASFFPAIPTPVARLSLATTSTIYLVGRANFAVSTLSMYGFLRARRVR